jgi:hypothetical protein
MLTCSKSGKVNLQHATNLKKEHPRSSRKRERGWQLGELASKGARLQLEEILILNHVS